MSTFAVDTPGSFPESPMEQDELVYPCKGCGEILEEGKAFELAGNRWHIDCFRCNTCQTLLDSDANLLLLGDGSLICNNCTYSCSACGNKIEDLAILTGDQAFCASCFRCRNCKRKIENLRYARTSQGIFCMSCHESLMARRRKKSKANRAPRGADANLPLVLDKSLPALPPTAVQPNAMRQPNFTPDAETPPPELYEVMPAEDSPMPRSLRPRRIASNPNLQAEVNGSEPENTTLPASTYDGRPREDGPVAGGDGDFFIPVALDSSSPIIPPPPRNHLRNKEGREDAAVKPRRRLSKRDYFGNSNAAGPSHWDTLRDSPANSRSSSSERNSADRNGKHTNAKVSPHIAFQEKGRRNSSEKTETIRKRKESIDHATAAAVAASAAAIGDKDHTFKLGEVPRRKSTHSRKGSSNSTISAAAEHDGKGTEREPLVSAPANPVEPLFYRLHQRMASVGEEPHMESPERSPDRLVHPQSIPIRDDSLGPMSRTKAIQRKEIRSDPSSPTTSSQQASVRKSPTEPSSTLSISSSTDSTLVNSEDRSTRSKGSSTSAGSTDTIAPPPRSAGRLGLSGFAAPPESSDSFTAPRAPPPPPTSDGRFRKHNDSISTLQSEYSRGEFPSSPHLLRYSAGGEFSMEEDMARILKGSDDQEHNGLQHTPSVLRRVSNAVKHGRSLSDKGASRAGPTNKWAYRSPGLNGSIDISSPISAISEHKDEASQLRAQLRRAQQTIVELEAEKHNLQENVSSSADVKQVNMELREKRSTMAFLDTQREMVVRELEIMTDRLAKAKDSGQPLDIKSFKTEILKDFTTSMQKLKDSLSGQIEDLIQRRNALANEIANLIQMKDKGFQEFESLSSKNTQLAELNNQLVHNIQELYKANRQPNGNTPVETPRGSTNGLGIYTHHQKENSEVSMDLNAALRADSLASYVMDNNDGGPTAVVAAPTVVNIRKGQPKKFNWRKGGQSVAKNMTKGLKAALVSDGKEKVSYKDGQYTVDGLPYGMLPSDQAAKAAGYVPRSATQLRPAPVMQGRPSGSTTDLVRDGIGLFGFDLQARCELEKRSIPSVVTRCIEEVELRGIDAEGIYRKSGGTGQVKLIQAGFERHNDYDISDVDLDIHAVTSTLKQYFRKLPTPLITFDVYDGLLDATHIEERDRRAMAMREVVGKLPKVHRDCLEFLVGHLGRVMLREQHNLMTSLNLAVVFAPTIMRPLSIEREMSDMQAQRNMVQSLLELSKVIFPAMAAQGAVGGAAAAAE